MKAITTFAAAVVTAAALSANTATAGFTATEGAITLYENSGGGGRSKVVRVISPAGGFARCYNIANCFDDRASSAIWDLRFQGFVYFYTRENCKGSNVYWTADTKTPAVNFALDGVDNSVSSIMIANDIITQYAYADACLYRRLSDENANAAQNSTIDALEPST